MTFQVIRNYRLFLIALTSLPSNSLDYNYFAFKHEETRAWCMFTFIISIRIGIFKLYFCASLLHPYSIRRFPKTSFHMRVFYEINTITYKDFNMI